MSHAPSTLPPPRSVRSSLLYNNRSARFAQHQLHMNRCNHSECVLSPLMKSRIDDFFGSVSPVMTTMNRHDYCFESASCSFSGPEESWFVEATAPRTTSSWPAPRLAPSSSSSIPPRLDDTVADLWFYNV